MVFLQQHVRELIQIICHFITFDYKPRRADHLKGCRFAYVRELFKTMNLRNAKMRHQSALLAIGKTLYPHRGCIGFNTTPINLLNMVCCTEVFVMPLYRTVTSAYHMPANQKFLRERR